MVLLYSPGGKVGPGSTFQVISELLHVSTDSTGYNVQLHRYINVVAGSSGFRGTNVNTTWAGTVSLYGSGTYAETKTNFHINFGSSYTMAAISASYTSGSGNYYSSGTQAQTYTVPKPTYTISYNANGGSGAPSNQTKTYGTDLTLSSTIPTREGYIFIGWSISSTATEATYQAGGKYTANSAATLYAVWERITFNVTFDAETNGGLIDSSGIVASTVEYGEEIGELPVATKKNNEFVEWNTKSDGTGETATETKQVYSNLVYYAIFKLKANCYIKKDGKNVPAMMYHRTNGKYETGELNIRTNGTYEQGTL